MSDVRQTRRDNVFRLLSDGLWHTTMEVNGVAVGGSRGVGRLWEIKQAILAGKYPGVVDVVKRKCVGSEQYQYRLVYGGSNPIVESDKEVGNA